jgi:hypothetical protein
MTFLNDTIRDSSKYKGNFSAKLVYDVRASQYNKFRSLTIMCFPFDRWINLIRGMHSVMPAGLRAIE